MPARSKESLIPPVDRTPPLRRLRRVAGDAGLRTLLGPGLARHPSERPSIYLVAPSGHPNYGDELILRGWLRHLERVQPDADVVVDCHTPGQAAVLHGREHPRVTFVDTLWRICAESEHLDEAEAADFAHRVIHDPGILCRIVSGIEMLARADVIHLVGGGYVNAVWPHHLALLAAASAAVERSGGSLVATGQGLTPVGGGRRLELLRRYVERFDVFDVRDTPSWEVIGDCAGASLTGDDAWLAIRDDGIYDTDSEASRRKYVFCLQIDLMDGFDGGRGVDGLTSAVSDIVDRWGIDGTDTAFVEGIPGADRVVYDRVVDLLPGAEFVPFTDVWWRGLPARRDQVWVSTRFHPHLVAAAAGARGIALSAGGDYYPVKHRSLVEAGSHWAVAETSTLPDAPADGGFGHETVARLRGEKTALAGRIYPDVPVPVRHVRSARRRFAARSASR